MDCPKKLRANLATSRPHVGWSYGTLVLVVLTLMMSPRPTTAGKCEPITVKLCEDMKWDKTYMPNLVHHSSQENADLILSQFESLLNLGCSRYLKFFLCGMFTPMCFQNEGDYPKIIPPCRKSCVHSRNSCLPEMVKYNVTWPEELACENLPEYHKGMCIMPEAFIDEPKCSHTNANHCRKQKCKKTGTSKKKKAFLSKRYDFVVQAKVLKVIQGPCDAKVNVSIIKVIKKNKIDFIPGPGTFVFNGTCACPKLKNGKTYFLGGHEKVSTGELFLHSGSLAQKYSKKWDRRFKKWFKPSRNVPLNRRRREGAKNKKNSKERKRKSDTKEK